MDNDLGGYVNADFCVNAEYFNNAGQYDADDEHNAVLVGQDSSKEGGYLTIHDDDIFWWDDQASRELTEHVEDEDG